MTVQVSGNAPSTQSVSDDKQCDEDSLNVPSKLKNNDNGNNANENIVKVSVDCNGVSHEDNDTTDNCNRNKTDAISSNGKADEMNVRDVSLSDSVGNDDQSSLRKQTKTNGTNVDVQTKTNSTDVDVNISRKDATDEVVIDIPSLSEENHENNVNAEMKDTEKDGSVDRNLIEKKDGSGKSGSTSSRCQSLSKSDVVVVDMNDDVDFDRGNEADDDCDISGERL